MEVYEAELVSDEKDEEEKVESLSENSGTLEGDQVIAKRSETDFLPASHNKKNLSFSTFEADKIQSDNDRILQNLVEIQVRKPKYKPEKPAPVRPHHAAINRKRQEDKIKQENYRLLNRLLTAKSTMNTRPPSTSKPKAKSTVRKAPASVVSLPQEEKVVDPSKWERG
ncbi:cilia- and flagella-associated protein 97-like [Bolinopsis microptera]|uniref:cilia- and flagella-associated protein 97-like n=1 Tax=Bolinopsis microptera TaxID=2820187 RepID=UPI003078B3DE